MEGSAANVRSEQGGFMSPLILALMPPIGSTGSHPESHLKKGTDKQRSTERKPPRTGKELKEEIYHEELNECSVLPGK